MIHIINQKRITIKLLDGKIILPEDLSKKIIKNFDELKQSGLNIWNGEVICVSNYKINDDSVSIICKKTDYAHYLYEERIGCPLEFRCMNLCGGCLFETIDGYYIIAELNDNTSYPNVLQLIGGTISNKDMINDNIDIMKTIIREVKEEININLLDNEKVIHNELKYMYVSEENDRPGIKIYSKAKISIDSKKVLEEFKTYNDYLERENKETEIKQLHLFKKEEVIERINALKNPKREYLIPLLERDLES